MTLDEAIKHAEEVTDKKEREKQKWDKWLESDYDHRAVAEKVSCELCAAEHRQLAEWLKDYKRLLEQDIISRQAVLNKIKEVCFSKEWLQFRVDNGSNGQRDFLINYIEQLPSVISQPKTTREDKGVLEQLAEEQNNLLATTKAWSNAIEKNGYVN